MHFVTRALQFQSKRAS